MPEVRRFPERPLLYEVDFYYARRGVLFRCMPVRSVPIFGEIIFIQGSPWKVIGDQGRQKLITPVAWPEVAWALERRQQEYLDSREKLAWESWYQEEFVRPKELEIEWWQHVKEHWDVIAERELLAWMYWYAAEQERHRAERSVADLKALLGGVGEYKPVRFTSQGTIDNRFERAWLLSLQAEQKNVKKYETQVRNYWLRKRAQDEKWERDLARGDVPAYLMRFGGRYKPRIRRGYIDGSHIHMQPRERPLDEIFCRGQRLRGPSVDYLPARACRVARRLGLWEVDDLATVTERQLLEVNGCGAGTVRQIKQALARRGKCLAEPG